MLMDIKCSAVSSILVQLTFDGGGHKERLIALGDLVDVEYNANGLRKRVEGKVIKISAVGTDPKTWYIIVDGSDDFDSAKARFSPMSILDCEIIRKADTISTVQTPIGSSGVPYIRIIKGRLQYSHDGFHWKPINVDRRDIIEEQSGTVPLPPHGHIPNEFECNPDNNEESDDDIIEESSY